MKIKNTMTALLTIVTLSLPAVSFASTYQFIDTSGNLKSVEANSATEALNTAYHLAVHSGVILATSYSKLDAMGGSDTSTNTAYTTADDYKYTGTGGANMYAYVKTNGDIGYITADSVSSALANATDIMYNSGVQVVVN